MSDLARALPRLLGRAWDLMRRPLLQYRWPVRVVLRLAWSAGRVAIGRRWTGLRWKPGTDVRLDLPGGPVWLGAETVEVDLITFWETFLIPSWPMPLERLADRFVLDVGAHRGYFGALAVQAGADEVWSYEPHPELFQSLSRSASQVAIPNVRWRPFRTAIGATRREADLQVSTESWSHSLHRPSRGEITGTVRVPVMPFTEVMDELRRHGAPRTLVKLNIEGTAGEVVLGTPAEDWADVEDLLLDYEQTTPEPFEDIEQHLRRAGLQLRASRGHSHWFTAVERGP